MSRRRPQHRRDAPLGSEAKGAWGLSNSTLPLVPGEAWSDAAKSDIEAMEGEERGAWVDLLQHCTRARGAKPAQKWSGGASALLEKIGRPAFERSVLRWFPLVERPRTRPVERGSQWQPDPNLLLQDEKADILRHSPGCV